MPLIFAFTGILLLIAAVRGTQDTLFGLVAGDFTGSNNFIFWVVAIVVIGMIGYVKPLKDFSTAFLVLLGAVILISNKGFFTNFQNAIKTTATAATAPATATVI